MSAKSDEERDNDQMRNLILREIEDFPQGTSNDVDEMRCDELGESSLQNNVRVLLHELELKDMEVL